MFKGLEADVVFVMANQQYEEEELSSFFMFKFKSQNASFRLSADKGVIPSFAESLDWTTIVQGWVYPHSENNIEVILYVPI